MPKPPRPIPGQRCPSQGEPEAGNDVQQSFRKGEIVHIDVPNTIADGAQSQHGGQLTFPVIRALVEDMRETLLEANGVGIAATQVYETSSLFIVASRPNPRYPDAPLMEPEVVINPRIVERSVGMVKGWEGCLSIPGVWGNVPRHRRIRARYQDLEGQEVEKEFDDFVARIFQHEYSNSRPEVFPWKSRRFSSSTS